MLRARTGSSLPPGYLSRLFRYKRTNCRTKLAVLTLRSSAIASIASKSELSISSVKRTGSSRIGLRPAPGLRPPRAPFVRFPLTGNPQVCSMICQDLFEPRTERRMVLVRLSAISLARSAGEFARSSNHLSSIFFGMRTALSRRICGILGSNALRVRSPIPSARAASAGRRARRSSRQSRSSTVLRGHPGAAAGRVSISGASGVVLMCRARGLNAAETPSS